MIPKIFFRNLIIILFNIMLSLPQNRAAGSVGKVYQYNSDTFRQQIIDLDGNFIMFYAPWCHHCKEFEPMWKELAELVNTKDSKFAIAQVDCTKNVKLCHECDITGYPTLLYYHKNLFEPIAYKGTRDLPSLTLFLSDAFTSNEKNAEASAEKDSSEVKIYAGMAYLNDNNVEKFVSSGQHFIMFFVPWCKASQRLAPTWAELALMYSRNEYIQIGQVNCQLSETTCKNFNVRHYPILLWIVNGRIMGQGFGMRTIENLSWYVETMLLSENHDPEKFMKKKKTLPVARITEETFETFMEKELVFVNYFAPWCAHCMQLNPLWLLLGQKFQNESRVLIADVDCVHSKNICEMEKVSRLPTLILYKSKEIVFTEDGSRPFENLVSLVNEYLQDCEDVDETDYVKDAETIKADGLKKKNEDLQKTEDSVSEEYSEIKDNAKEEL